MPIMLIMFGILTAITSTASNQQDDDDDAMVVAIIGMLIIDMPRCRR
jgi:hypothetical protein